MAVVNTLSQIITNYDASPRVLTSGFLAGANDTVGVGTVAAAATDSIGSTYRFAFISSGVRIEDIQMMNDATTAGIWQLGVYDNDQQPCVTTTGGVVTTAAPSVVPVANANLIFGAGISTAAQNPNWKSVYSPAVLAGGFAATNVQKRVWELLGLDLDPEYVFHIVLTATTAPTAAGNISLQYTFVR